MLFEVRLCSNDGCTDEEGLSARVFWVESAVNQYLARLAAI